MNHGPAPAASTAEEKPAVEAAGIFKQFGSTQALRGVDLTLQPGRCLGLVGRNGAGKSTLVSILSGIYPADAGQVRFEGQPAPPLGALDAWRSRIATVFQHSMVVPDLTVAENVFLGHQPGPGGLVDWRRMREQAQQIMADWGFRLDVGRPCSSLTVEQRQIVEIARALAAGHPVPAARRADRRAGARRRPAPVRPGAAARQQRGGRPLHLAPPRGSVRDLPGRRGDPRWRDRADRADQGPDQGGPDRGDGGARPGGGLGRGRHGPHWGGRRGGSRCSSGGA